MDIEDNKLRQSWMKQQLLDREPAMKAFRGMGIDDISAFIFVIDHNIG